MENSTEYNYENEQSENINIRQQIELYLIHWKWFVLGVFLSLLCAFLYLRYSTPVYKASALIMLKDDYRGGAANELTILSDLSFGGKDNVENEIHVLDSRTLSEKTVKKLNLHISYFSEGRIKSVDLYKNSPIRIEFIQTNEFYKNGISGLLIKGIDQNTYSLFLDEQQIGTYTYNQEVNNSLGVFVVKRNKAKVDKDKFEIAVMVETPEGAARRFRNGFQVISTGKFTSVLELSILNSNREKAEDYLNTLIELYNSEGIADRRFVSENTSDFLSNRLEILTKELTEVEGEVEQFKKEKGVTDIISEANIYIQNASEFEKKYIDINTQIGIIDNVTQGFLDEDTTGKTFPMLDALTSDPALAAVINQHNVMVLERNELAPSAGPENARIKQIDLEIEVLKKTIRDNLNQLKSNLLLTRSEINKQRSVLSGRIGSVPALEKEFKGIGRQQGVKEALYLYLLQKREETEISMVSLAPNAKVIDSALAPDIPVSPKRMIIFLAALILGVLIPFAIIYVINLLDTKVKSRMDIEKYLTVPFLGDVPRSESHEEIIRSESRSSSAEALRIVRTNMEFMLSQVPEEQAKTIFVTSTMPKEGKTFIAVNLAGTFALSGKKTLLIGMDIRNPRLSEYLKLPAKGLTNYLASNELSLESVIIKQDGYKEFYVMPPGVIPPNPAELLMSTKVEQMFDYLKKQFDYIIVDTAPMNLVTDTLLVAKNADAFIYIVRENYLDKRLLHIPQRLYKEQKLPNMSILLNDTYSRKGYGYYGYGYGYGYGADADKKSWYKRILEFGKRRPLNRE